MNRPNPDYRYFLIPLLFILGYQAGHAQAITDSFRYCKSRYSECESLLQKGKLNKAIECYESMSHDFPTYIRAYTRLSELYYEKKDKNRALYYANKAIDLNPNEAYAPMTYLANKMNSNGDNPTAVLILNRLSVSEVEGDKKNKVEERRVKYTMQSYANTTPVPGVELHNLGDSINTRENEYLPSLSLDGKTLVFTRRVDGNEDFYVSEPDSEKHWKKAHNIGYPPNTSMPDGGAKLSADGHYLFYTRCDMPSPDGIVGGGCDLVFSYMADSVWSSPQYFGFTLNTTAYEGQPCISSDNKDLYFVSNREGGYGGYDIWVSHFENNYWSKPVNLGPSVNTAKDETAPFIHPDNESLYFSSNGHPGLGESDLFLSRRNKNGTWKKPINLGAPINTAKFDGSIVVNAKGTMAICASDRQDTKGGLDLYSFDTYPAIQPVPTLCVSGFVIDKFYKTRLYDRPITFTYTFNNTVIGEQNSNEGDASFSQALQLGKTYAITLNEEGYRPYRKILKLTSDSLPDILPMDIKLKQPGIHDTLMRGEIGMDSTGYRIDSLYFAVLDTLGKQWPQWAEDSADVSIRFVGHYSSTAPKGSNPEQLQEYRDCQLKVNLIKRQLNDRGIYYGCMRQELIQEMLMDSAVDPAIENRIQFYVVEDY